MVYQEGLYFIELVIIVEYEHLFTNKVQTLKCTCKICDKYHVQFSNQRRIFIFSFGGGLDKYLGGAAACFGQGVVATPGKAKEKV